MMKKEKVKYKLDLSEVEDSEYKKLDCPSCKERVRSSDININDKIGKCNSCDAVFSIQNELNELLSNNKARQELIRPEGIDLFYFQDELDITVQQPISMVEFMMLLIFPAFAFISFLGFLKGKIDWIVPAVLTALSIIPTITALFKKRHKIYIGIDDKEITVKWRPKFLNPDKTIQIADIDQLYVSFTGDGYHLNLIVDEGAGQKHIKLISYLKNQTKAKFLEQEIEKYLGIKNVPVIGEHK